MRRVIRTGMAASVARLGGGVAHWRPWRSFALRGLRAAAIGAVVLGFVPLVSAAGCELRPLSQAEAGQLDVHGWLERMRQATDYSTYSGTFVVTSSSGVMSRSQVWHVCSKDQQIERLEALSGTPRIVYRQNADVRTFFPQDRVVRVDTREMPRKFPRAKGIDAQSLSQSYAAELGGLQSVAGRNAALLQLRSRDALRFGYRIWLDQESGLILKWQTVTPGGKVLEQATFTELELSTPAGAAQIQNMMNDVVGYRVIHQHKFPTTLESNGWQLPVPVNGFVLLDCSQKQKLHPQPLRTAQVQCVYSDGLASISVFLEPFNEDRHPFEGQELRVGATHTLSARVLGDSWVTIIGEVPLTTLQRFASAIKHTSG